MAKKITKLQREITDEFTLDCIAGFSVNFSEVKLLISRMDWAGRYPEADAVGGKYTGVVLCADENMFSENYAVVGNDYAVNWEHISFDEIRSDSELVEQWESVTGEDLRRVE